MRLLVLLASFVAGFSVMVLELLGGRLLAPWFGASLHVWGSLITVFMLALATGYFLGGRWSLRGATPQRYAAIFLAGALLSIPPVYLAEPLMGIVFARFEDPRYGSLLAALALFFAPAAVLGMASPYGVRLLATSRQTSGAVAGLLYFVSTLGSALGTLATAFYLVVFLDVDWIILGTAGMLGAVAAALGSVRREGR